MNHPGGMRLLLLLEFIISEARNCSRECVQALRVQSKIGRSMMPRFSLAPALVCEGLSAVGRAGFEPAKA
jgi:hypothetical protein